MADRDSTWLFFDSGPRHPHDNMAIDEALLDLDVDHPVVVRFYDWDPPGLSLGYFQRHIEFPPERVRVLGAVVTRRTTGGGAILHKGEITFSIAGDDGWEPFAGPVKDSYHAIHLALAAGLAALDVRADLRHGEPIDQAWGNAAGRCFYCVTSYDLVAEGRKLVGSAQRRTGGRVLHHGSIPLDPNPMTPEAACVNALHGEPLPRQQVIDALKQGLEEYFAIRLVEWQPSPELLSQATRIRQHKYATEEWLKRR